MKFFKKTCEYLLKNRFLLSLISFIATGLIFVFTSIVQTIPTTIDRKLYILAFYLLCMVLFVAIRELLIFLVYLCLKVFNRTLTLNLIFDKIKHYITSKTGISIIVVAFIFLDILCFCCIFLYDTFIWAKTLSLLTYIAITAINSIIIVFSDYFLKRKVIRFLFTVNFLYYIGLLTLAFKQVISKFEGCDNLYISFLWILVSTFFILKDFLYRKKDRGEFHNVSFVLTFYITIGLFLGAHFLKAFYFELAFGMFALIVLIYNLINVFLQNQKRKMLYVSLDLIIGMMLTVYVIYMVPSTTESSSLQNIITSIVAAVYGGLFTLIGVAWTIKDTNEKRQKDLERIDNERKEDERRQCRPIVNVFAGPYSGLKTDIDVFSWLHDTDNISKTATETLKVASKIHSCYFGNTDFSNVYVWGIKINGHMTHFCSIRYIKKESYFYLDFSDKPLYTEKPLETISLILEDVLENLYELPLEYTFSDSFNWYIIQGNNPSFYIGKAKREDNYEQHIDGEGISTLHNQSTDKKKWLY